MQENKEPVAILLSTYNGEKYIREQLDSILDQTYTNWHLYIRDDGSTDNTYDIIKEYSKNYKNITILDNDFYSNLDEVSLIFSSTHNFVGKNIGIVKSMLVLLNDVKRYDEEAEKNWYEHEAYDLELDFNFPHYAFCDQDDVWLKDKLEVSINKLSTMNQDKPALVYTDLKVVDENLKVINNSMVKSQSGKANTTLIEELTENSITGCTVVFNRELREMMISGFDSMLRFETGSHTLDVPYLDYHLIIMHDWWAGLLAATFGEIAFIDKPTMLYRQHSNNVLGARTWNKRLKQFINGGFFARYWKLIKRTQKQAELLQSVNYLTDGNIYPREFNYFNGYDMLTDYIDILDKKLIDRIKIIFKYNLKKNKFLHTLIFRFLLITKFKEKNGQI